MSESADFNRSAAQQFQEFIRLQGVTIGPVQLLALEFVFNVLNRIAQMEHALRDGDQGEIEDCRLFNDSAIFAIHHFSQELGVEGRAEFLLMIWPVLMWLNHRCGAADPGAVIMDVNRAAMLQQPAAMLWSHLKSQLRKLEGDAPAV